LSNLRGPPLPAAPERVDEADGATTLPRTLEVAVLADIGEREHQILKGERLARRLQHLRGNASMPLPGGSPVAGGAQF
jgi:hypothetical protein